MKKILLHSIKLENRHNSSSWEVQKLKTREVSKQKAKIKMCIQILKVRTIMRYLNHKRKIISK